MSNNVGKREIVIVGSPPQRYIFHDARTDAVAHQAVE